jgi:hypothetical protein
VRRISTWLSRELVTTAQLYSRGFNGLTKGFSHFGERWAGFILALGVVLVALASFAQVPAEKDVPQLLSAFGDGDGA